MQPAFGGVLGFDFSTGGVDPLLRFGRHQLPLETSHHSLPGE